MTEERKASPGEGKWLKVFCPESRCLTEDEIVKIPVEKRAAAEATGKPGLWLEVFCPENACLTEEEKVDASGEGKAGGKGAWLSLFCPEDRCVMDEDTDLP